MKLRRNLNIAARDLQVETDNETGEIIFKVRFSSEYPVPREVYDQYGDPAVYGEVLLHGSQDNADLSRLNDGVASLLFNHDYDQHLGIIIPGSAFIDIDEKAGYAKVKFSKVGTLAQEIAAKVREGTISNISFGYSLDSYELDDEKKLLLVDRWSVNEISFVTVPADPNACLIRSENGSLNIFKRGEQSPESFKQEIKKMTKRQKRASEEEIETLESAEEEIQEVEEEVKAEINSEEEEREDEVDEQVVEAVDIAAVAEAVMEIIEEREKRSNKKNKVRNVMTVKKDTIQTLESRFDLGEAIRCQLENKPMSGANKEFMQEQERKFGAARHAGGMHIPVSALAAGKRAAPSYSQASGTLNKVQQDVLKLDSFVDLLMPESLLGKLGVQTLTGQTERSILIPKQTATAVDSFGWVKEGADVPGGKGSYDNVPLSPKTFGGETVLTRRALTTTPGIQARVASDIVRNSALKLEKDMFGTSATDGPKSLLEQIPALRFGAAEWDYKNFLRILAEMTDKGVREELISFAMKGATKAELKGILKDANSLGIYLVGDDDKLVGRDIHSSGIFGGAEMLMGDFSAITIAEWSGLELVVDPWTYAKSGDIALRVFCDMDWAFTGQEGSLIHLKKGTVTK